MPMATIRKVGGEHDLYHIHFLDQHGATDPGYGQGRPDRPDHDLPGRPVRPDQGLPGSGAHPGNRPPGSGGGGIPDNELPDTPPPQVAPGMTLVLVRHEGKWQYATIAPGSPPPRPLPPSQGRPDNTLPGGPEIGGGPAPTPPPTAGQLPGQTPQPKR